MGGFSYRHLAMKRKNAVTAVLLSSLMKECYNKIEVMI